MANPVVQSVYNEVSHCLTHLLALDELPGSEIDLLGKCVLGRLVGARWDLLQAGAQETLDGAIVQQWLDAQDLIATLESRMAEDDE